MTNDKTTHKMTKHFPLLLLMLLVCFSYEKAQSQGMAQANPPIGASPDNEMLGGTSVGSALSGISASGLFNGSLNISVPIYNYKQDNTDYGVSLTYNTQGVKVDEFSTNTGLHWNLNYGGSIVRIQRDLPDEMLENTDSLLETDMYYINGVEQVDTTVPNKEMHLYGKWESYSQSQSRLNASNAYVDKECDEFIVSVFGKGFKFYIGKDLKVFTTSPQNYKVKLLADNTPIDNISQISELAAHKLSFKITDNKGISYIFQPGISDYFKGENQFWDWRAVMKNEDGQIPFISTLFPVSWQLKKVILANGDSITYKYAPSAYGGYSSYYSHLSYLNYFVRETPAQQYPLFLLGTTAPEPPANEFPLLEIDYPNGITVNFEYSTTKRNLKGNNLINNIKISSGPDCKMFQFYQDSLNSRYYLDSITQVSCDGTVSEPYYSFDYNKYYYLNVALPGQAPLYDTVLFLPKRLNQAQDLFGYYNGDSVGTPVYSYSDDRISIPKHNPPNAVNYGNERQYNADLARAGLIKTITNAYGEKQRFVYGPVTINTVPLADSTPTDNSFVGISQPDGVCIDSVIKTDPARPGHEQITVFSYSGGQIFMAGGYFHYPEEIDSATGTWKQMIYQSMFMTPHQLVNGANHGFSTVDMINLSDDVLLSRRVITYTNMMDATSGNEPRYYRVPGSKQYFQYPYTDKQYIRDWEIGLPLTITDYDQNNRMIKKVINAYNFSAVDLSAAAYIANSRTIKVNRGTGYNIPGYADLFYPDEKVFTDNYYPFKGVATVAKTVTQKYISDTRFVSDTVWYAYDNHNNLKRTVTQDSKGGKTATELVYNYDVDGPQFVFPGQPGYTAHPGTTLYNMSDSGLEIPVSTERWKLLPATTVTDPNGGTVLQNNNRLLSSFITGYRYQNGKLWTKSLWNTQNGSPLGYTDYTGLIAGMSANPYGKILGAYNSSEPVIYFKNTSTVTLFDAKGHPNETQLQDQDLYKAMIWDTASGQKLAEAANCRYSDIAYTSFETGLSGGNLSANVPSIATSSAVAITGSHVGILWLGITGTPGLAVSYTGTQDLKAGKSYILSFWVNGMTPVIYAGSQLLPLSSANMVYTKGGWTMYLMRFTPSAAGKIKISGTAANSLIDEIRLFPADAQMQSWTYEPLFGISSQTDASGRIIYYHYDKMGRQDLIFDMDGNILSKTDYHVAQ